MSFRFGTHLNRNDGTAEGDTSDPPGARGKTIKMDQHKREELRNKSGAGEGGAFVPTSVCPVCLCDFRSMLRVLQHAQKGSPKCRPAILDGLIEPASAEALVEADKAEQEWRVHCRKAGLAILSEE